MSMTVHYKHISPWLLALFKEQPELVEPFTIAISDTPSPGIPDKETLRKDNTPESRETFAMLDEMAEEMREMIRSSAPENAEKILAEAKANGFSLYKYFESVQFHISGEVTNHGTTLLSQAVTGGEDVGNDMGYGPATFLEADDVDTVAIMLANISDEEFLTKYSTDDWDEQETEYALTFFKGFAAYYADAAKAGHAMLVWGA